MKIVVVGMSHRTAPLEVRERFMVDDPAPALQKLVETDEIEEAALVSTCNRVEIVATTHRLTDARHTLVRFFEKELAARGDTRASEHLTERSGHEAVSHVFRVASALDSMVVGEPQILGQVKDAYRASVESGACGPVLSRLFHRAFSTAKRVKNETRIAERPVSVARVAVDLARQIFERFEDKSALLVGAGEMVELALEALRREGLEDIRVANRTVENAQELAARFGASAHSLDELDNLLPGADIVLTCVGGQRPLLDGDRVRAALGARRHPIFFIDIGVPRNVHADVDDIDSAYVYDIDDLQQVSAENAEERQRESRRAERIVLEEQERFEGWLAALEAVPTIRRLRERAEEIRSVEAERALARLELSNDMREAVDHLTRSIVNKLLHPPLARLRAETEREGGIAMLEAARELFALDDEGHEEDGLGPVDPERDGLAPVDPERGDEDEDPRKGNDE